MDSSPHNRAQQGEGDIYLRVWDVGIHAREVWDEAGAGDRAEAKEAGGGRGWRPLRHRRAACGCC